MHFDQYARGLNIFRFPAKIFGFRPKIRKQIRNLKKILLICKARWDESIDVKHQRFGIKMKSSYSFEYRGIDRQMESISECTLKDISNDIWHATKTEN